MYHAFAGYVLTFVRKEDNGKFYYISLEAVSSNPLIHSKKHRFALQKELGRGK